MRLSPHVRGEGIFLILLGVVMLVTQFVTNQPIHPFLIGQTVVYVVAGIIAVIRFDDIVGYLALVAATLIYMINPFIPIYRILVEGSGESWIPPLIRLAILIVLVIGVVHGFSIVREERTA